MVPQQFPLLNDPGACCSPCYARRGFHQAGHLVINLKAAKALGLTIPHSVLLRADELIQ